MGTIKMAPGLMAMGAKMSMSAVVLRKDGSIENLGVVAASPGLPQPNGRIIRHRTGSPEAIKARFEYFNHSALAPDTTEDWPMKYEVHGVSPHMEPGRSIEHEGETFQAAPIPSLIVELVPVGQSAESSTVKIVRPATEANVAKYARGNILEFTDNLVGD